MKRSKRIALLALLLALTVILSLIPVRVSSATLALTLLPVFVLALTQDLFTGALGGLVMGVTSLVMAYTLNAGTPTSPIFRDPLVSVLPRVLVPVAAFFVMKLLTALAARACRARSVAALKRIAGAYVREPCPEGKAFVPSSSAAVAPRRADPVPRALRALIDAVACLCGVVTNTGLVLGMMWAIYGGKSVNDIIISPEFMSAMLSINFVIELIVFPLLAPPIIAAVRKVSRRG